MNFIDRYPLIVTPVKDSSRDFWTSYFDFQIIFDSSWFTLLLLKTDPHLSRS